MNDSQSFPIHHRKILDNSETISDQLFYMISDDIIKGRFKPGEKMSEPEIARRYKTSRAPVREAIRRLEERGVVTRKPRSGPRVASFTIDGYIEIFEVRESLEGIACRLAAERMTDDDLENLKQVLDSHENELRNQPKGSYIIQARDMDFHYLIAKGSKNTALIRLLCDEYYLLLRLYRSKHSWKSGRGWRALKEHYRIMDALEERDEDLAEIMMRRHIKSAKDTLEKEYKKFKKDDIC